MEEIDLKELISYFISKIGLIIVVLLLVITLGNIYTVFIKKPMYSSNATVVLVSENNETYNTTNLQINKNLVGTYSEIIKSRKILSKVNDILDIDYNINTLMDNITVSSITNTEIIKISVIDEDKEKASLIANAIANVFTEEIKEIYNLSNVYILDNAIIENNPYNINYLKDNLIYSLMGIVLSLSIVFIIYYFDTSIKSSEVIEDKLGLVVLGIVPMEVKE